MGDTASPFAMLSFIVAPAILTNAAAVLTMSTSNRLGRTVDRARELSRLLESGGLSRDESAQHLRQLEHHEFRALLILRALCWFYLALGGFAAAALLSLFGAVLISVEPAQLSWALEATAGLSGVVGVGSLVYGSSILVRETGAAVATLRERADNLRARLRTQG